MSLKAIKRAIEEHGCFVNGRPERFASYEVKVEDQIKFTPPKHTSIEILYEDKHLLIVNKPPFCLSQDFFGHKLVHRLDKETSGCLLLAKTPEIEKALVALFRERQVSKEYLALVEGVPPATGVIREPIEGLSAETGWRLEQKAPSLIRCYPKTGRTHQIRIHLAWLGHPIWGDWRYKSCKPAKRVMLHAAKIGFVHPVTKQWLSIEAPLPEDFREALNH